MNGEHSQLALYCYPDYLFVVSMSKIEVKGIVAAWGLRLQVPAAVLRELGLRAGDPVLWSVEERNGKKYAILFKSDGDVNERHN